MEVILRKLPSGAMAPIGEEEAQKLKRLKIGAGVRCKVVQIRNYKFLRKYFALINYLFDIWEDTMPRQQYRGMDVRPNVDKFREGLTILTGRYDATYDVFGGVHLEAHSISFANMEEAEFERLFSDTIQVALDRVLNRPDLDEATIRAHVAEILRYDS